MPAAKPEGQKRPVQIFMSPKTHDDFRFLVKNTGRKIGASVEAAMREWIDRHYNELPPQYRDSLNELRLLFPADRREA